MTQNISNTSYDIPQDLVFLSMADYERLSSDKQKFVFHRNDEDYRNPFERDRARIIHSPFFRSLAGKTQVFGPNQSDFFRTRLTHSLEVAQIAKVMLIQICEKYRELRIEPQLSPWEQVHLCDLVEAICLAHDIGQPPFGHVGEDSLDKTARDIGGEGFEANAQSLRVLTCLDSAYPGRAGFTRGVLAGIMKYKIRNSLGLSKFIYDNDWPVVESACPFWNHDKMQQESKSNIGFQMVVKQSRTFPCQIMDLADEITYAGHDLEDIMYTSLLRYSIISNITDVISQVGPETVEKIERDVDMQSACGISSSILKDAWMQLRSHILDVMNSSNIYKFNIAAHKLRREHMNMASISCSAKKDKLGRWIVLISQEAAIRSALIRYVVVPTVYKDSKLTTLQYKGSNVLNRILRELSINGNKLLPLEHQERFILANNNRERVRVCCDFIAGLTEDYTLRLYQRLFESERGTLTDFF